MIVIVFLLLAELCSLSIFSFVCYTMPRMCKIYALINQAQHNGLVSGHLADFAIAEQDGLLAEIAL